MSAAPESTPPSATSESQPNPKRVLIVEDNADVGWLMKSLVEHCGYEARWVTSAQEALDAIAAFCPGIALVDIGLPGADGYELAAMCQAISSANRPVLVALTGHSGDEHRQKSLQAGFVRHLVKPVSMKALAMFCKSLLKLVAGPQRGRCYRSCADTIGTPPYRPKDGDFNA